ncbi:MAG: hypothetical protein K2K50_02550, partial [Anaeroplasmataceae bacterium]|nr:hypothetical protein [Anaeroplasmataceae bacterium]
MRKSILKHILFVVILTIIITAYFLALFYIPGTSYHYLFLLDYIILILWLTNTFYFKKNTGIIFKILIGLGSFIYFFPLIAILPIYLNRVAFDRCLV